MARTHQEAVVTHKWRSAGAAFVMMTALAAVVIAQGAKPAVATTPREQNLKAYVELLRADLRTQKIALITQLMHFTDAEDQAFWPIYRQYETDLAKLNDQQLQGIETYSKTYASLTDATANDLMTKALDLEAKRVTLKQKYFSQLKAAMSPKTAARALQVENQILLLLDLQVASSLPVAE